MKFDILVTKILNEEMPQPFQGYDASHMRSIRGKESEGAEARSQADYNNSLETLKSRERNAGGDRAKPHYIVFGDEKCQSWHRKSLPDTTMARYGWKSFPLSQKYNARVAAEEFAKKWGLKEPRYVAS